jgi:hypothetical protein
MVFPGLEEAFFLGFGSETSERLMFVEHQSTSGTKIKAA